MTALVSAQSVREFYRELWVSVHKAPAPDLLANDRPLPPFLCRSLAFGTPSLPIDCGGPLALTGMRDGIVQRIEAGAGFALHWGTSGISPQLYDYAAIAGHSVTGFSKDRMALLEDALALLNDVGETFVASVCSFIGMMVWLEFDDQDTGESALVASSFPRLPHCVVVTDRAATAVLPNHHLGSFSAWALAESLYHESLHQVLSATILQEEVFVEEFTADEAATIHAAWRNADWTLDRSLHALFVYAGISSMRRRLLDLNKTDGIDRTVLARVQKESALAATHLGAALDRHRSIFTPPGNQLLTELQAIV